MRFEYKVHVLRRGEASLWAVQLNKFGEDGWELVQVYEFAAIFKQLKKE